MPDHETFSLDGKAVIRRLCIVVLFSALTLPAYADEPGETEPPSRLNYGYVQVWLGFTDTEDSWTIDDSEGNELIGDYSDLPLGGGVGQRLWGDRGQYGFEGGGLISWRNNDVDFSGADPDIINNIAMQVFLSVEGFLVSGAAGSGQSDAYFEALMVNLESFLANYLSD